MKYILLLGFIFSFSVTNLIAQSNLDSLKSKMKMVKEVLYKVEDGELRNRENLFDSNISSYTVYDKNGKIIENGRYEKDGSLYEKTFYERNENGDSQKGLKKIHQKNLKVNGLTNMT